MHTYGRHEASSDCHLIRSRQTWNPLAQGLALLTANPVLANGIAGLATSAIAQATIQVKHSAAARLFSACWKPCSWSIGFLQEGSWQAHSHRWERQLIR